MPKESTACLTKNYKVTIAFSFKLKFFLIFFVKAYFFLNWIVDTNSV